MAATKILYDGPDAVWLVNNLMFPFADHQGNTFFPGVPTKVQKTSWTDAQVANAVLCVYTASESAKPSAPATVEKPAVQASKVGAPKPADPAKASA